MRIFKTKWMLGKNWLLTTFCGILFLSGSAEALYDWESVSVVAVIGTQQYLLSDGRQVRLAGIDAIDLLQPAKEGACLTENLKLQLPVWLNSRKVKIKKSKPQARRAQVFDVYLKFGSHDLAEFLLALGLASTTEEINNKDYIKAQKQAQRNHLGIWGQCDPHLKLVKWKKARGRSNWFWDKYHPYLGRISSGRVTKVLSANTFQLDNDLKIQLADIDIPDVAQGVAYECFMNEAQQYLESVLLGQRVLMLSEGKKIEKYKTLERQVYLPANSWRSEVWVNRHLIASGYGRLEHKSDNEELIKTQRLAWEKPLGAWDVCLESFLEDSFAKN